MSGSKFPPKTAVVYIWVIEFYFCRRHPFGLLNDMTENGFCFQSTLENVYLINTPTNAHIYSFNDLKFTVKHLKRFCMFRSYDHPQGAYIQSYSSKTISDINRYINVDKKNQLDVTFCILYFSSNSCSTCFGQPCVHHQELTTA